MPVLLAGVLLVGCCGTREQSRPQQESRLKKLALLYGRFVGVHRGQPPKDEEAFREYIASLRPEELTSMGIDDPDQLFISERDGQPYTVLYGDAPRTSAAGGAPVIAYEQVGAGGRRYVANNLGAVEEVAEQRFQELVPQGTQP